MKNIVNLLVVAVLTLCPGFVVGQIVPCPLGDDGFNVGCCNVPNPNLPQFPPIQMQASYACINNCNFNNAALANVSIAAPNYFFCDYAITNVSIMFPGGLGLTGPVVMKYARTWTEFPVGGLPPVQIWRFLVNGDFTSPTPVPVTSTCPIPPCINVFGAVHYDGFIDYACNSFGPAAAPYVAAINLNHHAGCLSHAPWSDRPLAGAASHPSTSYHLVGPAPFAFGPVVEPAGPLIGESVRSSGFSLVPLSYQCAGEARLQGGNLVTVNQNCLCQTIAAAPPLWKHQALNGAVCCMGAVTPFNSIPIPGTPVAATGFVAMTLGTWGAMPFYPAGRTLTIYFGVLLYNDPCGLANLPIHLVTGVSTSSQIPGMLFPSPIAACGPAIAPNPRSFIDLKNNLTFVGGGLNIGFGSLAASDVVWNLNTP